MKYVNQFYDFDIRSVAYRLLEMELDYSMSTKRSETYLQREREEERQS